MEIPNSVRYFQRLNEMVKELAKEVESEKKGEKMKLYTAEVRMDEVEEWLSMKQLNSYTNCDVRAICRIITGLYGSSKTDVGPRALNKD